MFPNSHNFFDTCIVIPLLDSLYPFIALNVLPEPAFFDLLALAFATSTSETAYNHLPILKLCSAFQVLKKSIPAFCNFQTIF